jgi:glycosyltransferase involved in cell wall biosynthesis
MRFSLIMGTLGRSAELERFLLALQAQTYQDFQLIVVDQNTDDRVARSLSPFLSQMQILHLKTPSRGLSRARNLGLQEVQGDIVAFPDDDCWYPPQLLQQVHTFFEEHPADAGLTIKAVDALGEKLVRQASDRPTQINRQNIFGSGKSISYCIFLRTAVIEKTGTFDETLGLGAGTPWGAGEETDYLLRSITIGSVLQHRPELYVHHPRKIIPTDINYWQRISRYSRGRGKVLHKNGYSGLTILGLCVRGIGSSLYGLIRYRDWGSLKVGMLRTQGLLLGWWAK